jgi:hypothetical protein
MAELQSEIVLLKLCVRWCRPWGLHIADASTLETRLQLSSRDNVKVWSHKVVAGS